MLLDFILFVVSFITFVAAFLLLVICVGWMLKRDGVIDRLFPGYFWPLRMKEMK